MVIREYLCVVSPANQLSQRNETIFYVPIYIEKRRGKKKKELNIPVVVLETTTLTAGRNPPINDDKPATTLKSKHTKKKKENGVKLSTLLLKPNQSEGCLKRRKKKHNKYRQKRFPMRENKAQETQTSPRGCLWGSPFWGSDTPNQRTK